MGDSSYPKFNWAAKKIQKRLAQLGATELLEICEADEQGDEGIDGAFLNWSSQLHAKLSVDYPLPEGLEIIPDHVQFPSRWRLHIVDQGVTHPNDHAIDFNNVPTPRTVDYDIRTISGSFKVVLKTNDRVTPQNHWQDVRYIRLETEGCLEYMPGDALAILPKNDKRDVQVLIERMGWQDVADCNVMLVGKDALNGLRLDLKPPVVSMNTGGVTTLRELLVGHLDITAIPRRSFFANIAKYTVDEMHQERLIEFTNSRYLDEYFDYASRPRRSIIEVLQEFDSVKIPWQEATNVFPALRPRQFSIASSGRINDTKKAQTSFDLLVAIVKYRTVIKRIREGVCTRYLAGLETGSTLQIVLRNDGRLCTRSDINAGPHLLIGGGTGIAPLRAITQEKLTASSEIKHRLLDSMLIFGARNANADYFFEEEWNDLASLGLMVVTAFSRDQQHKIYVQDRIREHAARINDLIVHKHGTIIVCGSSGEMPKAVRAALADVLTSHADGGPTAGESGAGEAYLSKLENQGRYKQETW